MICDHDSDKREQRGEGQLHICLACGTVGLSLALLWGISLHMLCFYVPHVGLTGPQNMLNLLEVKSCQRGVMRWQHNARMCLYVVNEMMEDRKGAPASRCRTPRLVTRVHLTASANKLKHIQRAQTTQNNCLGHRRGIPISFSQYSVADINLRT